MIKLRDLLCCCGGGNEVYIMGDSIPELILPNPIKKSKTYLNEEILDREVRNISAYNGHLHVQLSEKRNYQCKRMFSLFKYVYADGTVKYEDNNHSYSSGLVRKIIDEMFPITMPYMPGKPIEVYCEDFLTDKKNGYFDTVGVFYALKTENGKQEKIEINRFFREPEGDEEGDWTEISKEEYYERKERQITADDILGEVREVMEDEK